MPTHSKKNTATLGQRLYAATDTLSPITDTPRLDAEILMAHALNLSRAQLLARLGDLYIENDFEPLLQRRLNYEPLAYILGSWEFFGLDLLCEPPLLVPRPETEHLVEVALEYLNEISHIIDIPRVLDLCTGTGCVAIAIAKNAPNAQLIATDLNPDALHLAARNSRKHNVSFALCQGDLFNALPKDITPFNVIVANPPYVESGDWDTLSPVITRHEDPHALLAGEDGLDCIRQIISKAPDFLVPDGLLAFELGEGQAESAQTLLRDVGYTDIGTQKDLAGIERIVFGRTHKIR